MNPAEAATTPDPPVDLAASDALAFAVEAARRVALQRIEDVVVLDLRGLSPVADFFVLGTGTSDRQMHSVLDEIAAYARSVGRRPFRVADSSDASWVLADYVDVMLHLFDREHRAYYDLDGLWGDAARIDWAASRGNDTAGG